MYIAGKRGTIAILVVLAIAGIGAAMIGFGLVVGGVETRTTSPSAEQVAYAREYLYISPEIEIEPLAYYIKNGMDHIVRFKFIAKTDDPALVFDSTQIAASAFSADYEFPPREPSHNEAWWDISAQPLTGGEAWVPKTEPHRFYWLMHIGCADNGDGTLTVYVSRVEHGKYRS